MTSRNKTILVASIIIVATVGILYQRGILSLQPEYPVLSDPSAKPASQEVPAVFLQSGTVMAVSASSLTIRYATPATATQPPPPGASVPPTAPAFSAISFPISTTTKIFLLKKEVVDQKTILNETPATIADIAVGTLVTVHIPSKTLTAIAPTKIQILPK